MDGWSTEYPPHSTKPKRGEKCAQSCKGVLKRWTAVSPLKQRVNHSAVLMHPGISWKQALSLKILSCLIRRLSQPQFCPQLLFCPQSTMSNRNTYLPCYMIHHFTYMIVSSSPKKMIVSRITVATLLEINSISHSLTAGRFLHPCDLLNSNRSTIIVVHMLYTRLQIQEPLHGFYYQKYTMRATHKAQKHIPDYFLISDYGNCPFAETTNNVTQKDRKETETQTLIKILVQRSNLTCAN